MRPRAVHVHHPGMVLLLAWSQAKRIALLCQVISRLNHVVSNHVLSHVVGSLALSRLAGVIVDVSANVRVRILAILAPK